jgi:hypothetical protein
MTFYGVDARRFDRNGNPYANVGELETTDYGKAVEAATRWARSHPNATSQIYRDGDPYLSIDVSYDLARDETTVYEKDLVYGHEKVTVNGRVVRDSRDCAMPSVAGWQLGEE